MYSYEKGLFLVFEGGEGSGKTTQAKALYAALTKQGVDAMLTREPGDTFLGADIRNILLDRGRPQITKRAEALLFAADRAEHVEMVIRPALERGQVVVCDRYIASSIAYQAYGGGLPIDAIREISNWAADGLYPDVTFFLNISPKTGLQRASTVKRTRFEDKDITYHNRVREGFREQLNNSWVHIDAGRASIEVVHEMVLDRVNQELIHYGGVSNPSVSNEIHPRCYVRTCNVLLDQGDVFGQYVCPCGHGTLILGPKSTP